MLPWLASAALAQAQAACAAPRAGVPPRTPPNAAAFRDQDDCFDDPRDDDCDASTGSTAPPPAFNASPNHPSDRNDTDRNDASDCDDTSDCNNSAVRARASVPMYRGGFGSYFWLGGG